MSVEETLTIENAKPAHIDELRKICIATTNEHFKKRPELVTLLFCDYYILCQPELTFILKDGEKIVGYIMGADAGRYVKEFIPLFKTAVRKVSLIRALGLSVRPDKTLIKQGFDYHLHINILKPYTGKGYGKKLMDKLVETVKLRGAKGLYLGVGEDNDGATRFYKKYGFTTNKRYKGWLSMVMKLK